LDREMAGFTATMRDSASGLDPLIENMLGFAKAADDADAGLQTVAGGAYAAVKGFQVFGIGLTGLHWILMGTFEALATLLPAMTALGAGALVDAEGATWIADK